MRVLDPCDMLRETEEARLIEDDRRASGSGYRKIVTSIDDATGEVFVKASI